MLNKTIAIYAIIDDLLKAIGHDEDVRINACPYRRASPVPVPQPRLVLRLQPAPCP